MLYIIKLSDINRGVRSEARSERPPPLAIRNIGAFRLAPVCAHGASASGRSVELRPVRRSSAAWQRRVPRTNHDQCPGPSRPAMPQCVARLSSGAAASPEQAAAVRAVTVGRSSCGMLACVRCAPSKNTSVRKSVQHRVRLSTGGSMLTGFCSQASCYL